MAALIHSNSRISETKETLRAEIRAETTALRAEMAANRAEMQAQQVRFDAQMAAIRADMQTQQAHIDAGFERLHAALKIHELEHTSRTPAVSSAASGR